MNSNKKTDKTKVLRQGRILSLGIFLFCVLTLSGCKARQLARRTPQMDVEQRFWVRVLLLDGVESCTLRFPSAFSVVEGEDILPIQIGDVYFPKPDGPVNVNVTADKITIAGRSFEGSKVTIFPEEPYIFNLNGDDYRGKLKLIANPNGDCFKVINLVPLEPYLAGVVGAEMPDYWEPEALKAQAIAARTYCLYIKKQFGKKRDWDVTTTAANQVYRGVAAESAQVWNAVNQTHGQVLVAKSKKRDSEFPIYDKQYEIFPAYYSSTCGGHTENSKNVFGDSFEPLVGVYCPYCRNVAKLSILFWPMVQFDKDLVSKKLIERYPKLKQLGKITNIIPVKQSNYDEFSRITLVKLIGLTGKSELLRAEDLRLTIDPTGQKIRSTICRIVSIEDKIAFVSGRGYGHGVGMCQCGAEGLARQGKTARQILYYYYPGSETVSIY